MPTDTMNLARQHLAGVDPELGPWMQRIGPLQLSQNPQQPFVALLRAIAHQQLHAQAAQSVLARLWALSEGQCPDAAQLHAYTPEQLRSCGFSAGKSAALHDLAAHQLAGHIPDREQAASMTDAELIARLSQIRGIGRWTVEMMLIHTLGRSDVLPAEDFGLRSGFRVLRQLETLPRPRQLAEAGQIYAPWRSLASLYLWRISDFYKKIPTPRPD